jgi:hypothetical protein
MDSQQDDGHNTSGQQLAHLLSPPFVSDKKTSLENLRPAIANLGTVQ